MKTYKNNNNNISSSSSSSSGIGFVGLLTILFIALKLTGYIDWSWIWVLSPIWVSIILGILFFVIIFIISIKNKF